MTRRHIQRIDVDLGDVKRIIERAAGIGDDERTMLVGLVDTLAWVTHELEAKRVSIQRLRKLLFGVKTEKLANLLGKGADETPGTPPESDHANRCQADGAPDNGASHDTPKKKRKGHGRHAAHEYTGATQTHVAHDSLKPGDPCPLPGCTSGKVYPLPDPAVMVRIWGQAPLGADVTCCDRLRCNACGEVFTAQTQAQATSAKYDPTAAAMIALLRYGTGVPFHRLEQLQAGFGIPLPSGTQWEIVNKAVGPAEMIHGELVVQAAQSGLVHNDDTVARVLALGSTKQDQDEPTTEQRSSSKRTGVFTTSVVAIDQQGHRIVLFFTGRKHAGENLALVLAHRAVESKPPIQMSDGLWRNVPKLPGAPRGLPKRLKTIWGNCLAHARRKYADLTNAFRPECQHVLEALAEVYHYDEVAARQQMSAEERLQWHKTYSAPVMNDLRTWLRAQFDEHKVEPNSSLGEAIKYMLGHWHRLTLFLRIPGAVLDNNICERTLKMAIRHRRNSLFYKTERGAHVGDVYMSLIHTARLCGVDPFDYLVAINLHRDLVSACPSDWLPWNYRDTLARQLAA